MRGRGSDHNPKNRFETLAYATDPDIEQVEPDASSPQTQLLIDNSKTVFSRNQSPDVGFDLSINPYRGCEHGCVYCYARPTHEYLGMSAWLDFETKIVVKKNAPELLRKELSSPKWQPQTVVMSGVTDLYQPIERRLQITRKLLEVFAEFKNPIVLITKNALVTRDIDILSKLAEVNAVYVVLSVTTLDSELCGKLEPRTSRPSARLEAIEKLSAAGIPTGVNVAPIIPGLTDHEVTNILKAAHKSGARHAGFTMVRLPYGVGPLFEEWLETHYPERKSKVLGRIRDMRSGRLNDPDFGSRMRGEGPYAKQIEQLFKLSCSRVGLNVIPIRLQTEHFVRPTGPQLSLFA